VREFFIVESNIEEEFKIEILKEFKVPFPRVLIETKIEFLLLFNGEIEIGDGNFFHTKFFGYLETKVSSDNNIESLWILINDDRIYESKFLYTFFEMLQLFWSMLARIVFSGVEKVYWHMLYFM
jgi:hypothetical protein